MGKVAIASSARGVRVKPNLDRPFGLVGPYESKRWAFEAGMRHTPPSISWTRQMSNGLPLDHELNAAFLEMGRRFFTAARNGAFSLGKQAVSTCVSATYDLFQVFDHVISEGYGSLAELPANAAEKLILRMSGRSAGAIESKHVRATVIRRLTVLEVLSEHFQPSSPDSVLPDGFRFPVFSSHRDVLALAKLIAEPQGHTPDAPPEVVFGFLNSAIEYVQSYADDIIALADRERKLRVEIEEVGLPQSRRQHRAPEIASVLLKALEVQPKWLSPSGKIHKSALAESLQMLPSVLSHKRYASLFTLFGLVRTGGADVATAEAYLELQAISRTAKPPTGLPSITGEIAKRLRLPFVGTSGRLAPWPIVLVGNSQGGKNGLMSSVSDLWTAGYLILAAFLADRESEALAIEEDCLHKGLDGYYLKTPTFKARNVESGSILLQPCPEIVVAAVRVLQRLGRSARLATGSIKLFCVHHSTGASVPSVDELRDRIDRFGVRTGSNLYSSGSEKWHLAPHQLRRFFVTVWVNYYEFGGRFQALSQALDHATVGATLRYAGTTIQGDALSRQQKELAVKVMGKLITGDLRASGPIANELMRFQNRLRIKVMPPEQLLNWTIQRTERNDTMLYPMPWGYCAWSKISGRYAQCLEKAQRKVGIPRPDNKKRPCICGSGCKQFLRTPEFEGFWEHAGERHQQIMDNPAAPDRLVEAAREGVRIARQSERMETL